MCILVSPTTSSCLGQSAGREATQCLLCALPRDICSTKCLFSHRRETTASNQPSLIQCPAAYLRSLHLLVYSFWHKMYAETLQFSTEAPVESLLTITLHNPGSNESAKLVLQPWAALGPGRAVGARWCPGCREQRQAVSCRWPSPGTEHCCVPTLAPLMLAHTHPDASRMEGLGFGKTSCAPAQRHRQRQLSLQALTAAW